MENNDLNRDQFTEYDATINQFLINSYSNPFIKKPFPQEIEIFLEFMDYIADYLCSIVEKSYEKPLISVIMPVYNRKNIVMNAIDSVLNQTYDNFELIIVDDASTDGTAELLNEIEHEKIHVFYHDENKDCCGARNTGLKKAKGEYIAYLDSDNIMCEKFLEANYGAFLKFPDADCIYSAQSRHDDYEASTHTILFGSLNKSGLLNRNFVDANTIFHKKEIIERIGGFDETLNREEDWDLILRILNNYKVYGIPFLQSRYHTNIADNRMSESKRSNFKKIRTKNAKFYTDCSNLNKQVNIIIPIFNTCQNLQECVDSIFSLHNSDKIKVTISKNSSEIDLSDLEFESKNIKIVESKPDLGFLDSLNRCIEQLDNDEDILILSQDAILTKGSLESMQKYAYCLDNCGLITSQQITKNSSFIKKYFNYINIGYWIDVAPFRFEDNIVEIPVFYDGDYLELKSSPFFCTYLKREILDECNDLNFKFKDYEKSMIEFSNFIRHKLGLKIFSISDAKVFQCQ